MAKGTQTQRTPSRSPQQSAPPKRDVATVRGGGSVQDPELLKMMNEDAGKGVSTSVEDNIVPLVYVLQSNSPQLDRGNKEKYIGKDAKAGDIWLRGTKQYADADTESDDSGIIVVPCHFSKCWIEWKPDRGGFVGRHATRPRDAVLRTEKSEDGDRDRQVWRLPNGNSVVETREHVVLITGGMPGLSKPTPFVIPMSSTNHTSSREWMGLMNNVQTPSTEKTAPSYACEYRLVTVRKENDAGAWYMWRAQHADEEDGMLVPRFVRDIALYKMAKKINADFTSGALRADAPDAPADEEDVDGRTGTGDDDM